VIRGAGWSFRAIRDVSQFLGYEFIQNSGALRDEPKFPPVLIHKQKGLTLHSVQAAGGRYKCKHLEEAR
jgi:hypothetical protein